PDIERGHREGRELGVQRPDADDLGGDIHVANGHPHAPDSAANQILGGEGEHHRNREHEDVGPSRRVDRKTEQLDAADRDRARWRVVGEPFDARERPLEEELGGQRRDREIKPLDAQRGESEQEADQHRHHAGEQEDQDDVGLRQPQREIVGGVGADRHEAAGAERELAAIAGEDIEPYRGDRENEYRDQHLGIKILAGEQRHPEERERDQDDDRPAILRDREDRLVGVVGGLELADFAIEHGRHTRSMMRSPNRPCGRNSRNTSASTRANQFSMQPPARSKVRMRTGPSSTSASFSPAPMISPPTMAPGIEVKPPRMSTGSALSAMSESENCTPSLAPHIMPATNATSPDTAHTISQI